MNYPGMWQSLGRIQAAAERIRDLQTPEYWEETMDDLVARAEKIWTAKERRLNDIIWLGESLSELSDANLLKIGQLTIGGIGNNEKIGAMIRVWLEGEAEKAATKEVDE
jgi:hypothetical protein